VILTKKRFKLYALLQEEFQEKALEIIADQGSLTVFDRIEAFEEFDNTEELPMQQAIIHLERWFMAPNDKFKNSLYLEYKNRKKCSLEDAKLAVNRLFAEEPGQAGDEFTGGGRAPDYQ